MGVGMSGNPGIREQELIEKVKVAISRLILDEPFLGYLAKQFTITLNSEIPTAVTDGVKITIGKGFVERLSVRQLEAVLAHEVMHSVLLHPLRGRGYDPGLYNVVADIVVNERIVDLISQVDGALFCNAVSVYVPVDKCREMNAEELYEVLAGKLKAIMQPTFGYDISQSQGQNQGQNRGDKDDQNELQGSSGGNRQPGSQTQSQSSGQGQSQGNGEIVVQEGNIKPEDLPSEIVRRVVSASVVAKSIGRLPGWAERLIKDLLKPRINWKVLLRSYLNEGERVKRTWSRQNRKIPVMPGKQLYGKITAWVLVDASVSISDNELREFLTEVLGIASIGRIMVVFWDSDIESVVEVKGKSDIPKMLKSVKGGGGTVIKPALEYATKRMKPNDWLIIMSDWCIYDIGSAEVQEILKRHGDRVIAVKSKGAVKTPQIIRKVVELA